MLGNDWWTTKAGQERLKLLESREWRMDTLITYFINLRNEYRKNKEFDKADEIRNFLNDIAIEIKDYPTFTTYFLK